MVASCIYHLIESPMYCCVECGKSTGEIFLRRKSYFQVNRCGNCGNFVDKYFELSATVQFIELLLLKDEVLRHFIFNVSISSRTFAFYITILAWLKLVLLLRNSPFEVVINHIYRHQYQKEMVNAFFLCKIGLYIIFIFLEYLSYVFVIKLFRFASNFNAASILKVIVFSSYFQLFNFLAVIWDYQDCTVHEVVTDVLTTMANIKSMSILTRKSCKNIYTGILFAKAVSLGTSLVLKMLFD